jgi:hypothetical protein
MNVDTDFGIDPLGVLLIVAKYTPEQRRKAGQQMRRMALVQAENRSWPGRPAVEPDGVQLMAASELERDDREAVAKRIRTLARNRYARAVKIARQLEGATP